jgi:putative intracellular protease/amidase
MIVADCLIHEVVTTRFDAIILPGGMPGMLVLLKYEGTGRGGASFGGPLMLMKEYVSLLCVSMCNKQGADNLAQSKELFELLEAQMKRGGLYGAICASPVVVLLRLGLARGKKITCYPSFAKEIKDPCVVEKRVVVDGNCITSQGYVPQHHGEQEEEIEVTQQLFVSTSQSRDSSRVLSCNC